MLAVLKRELKSYFYSPVAYVIIGLFIFLNSLFFIQNLYMGFGDFSSNVSAMSFVTLLIIPVLTMRTWAEERKNNTEVMLLTSPVSLWRIVLGKYLGALSVILVLTVVTFLYPLILILNGGPLTAQLIGAYIGFVLMNVACVAVGIFASSLTENQVIAAIISFISLLAMWIMDFVATFTGGILAQILKWFSILSRYDDFNRGILSLSPIVYDISFAAVFLFLTVRVIEKRRWEQGG